MGPGRWSIDTDFEEDPRYAVTNREALFAFVYWIAFTLVISGIAWFLGGGKSAGELSFLFGFPQWFFWSCLVAALVLSLVPPIIVHLFYTEVPLDASYREETEQ